MTEPYLPKLGMHRVQRLILEIVRISIRLFRGPGVSFINRTLSLSLYIHIYI